MHDGLVLFECRALGSDLTSEGSLHCILSRSGFEVNNLFNIQFITLEEFDPICESANLPYAH